MDRLKVDGQIVDEADFSFKELRQIRALCRDELWEDEEGEYSWNKVSEFDAAIATIVVFKRRTDPTYTLDQALELKPEEVLIDEDEPVPPTKVGSRGSAPKRAAKPKIPAATGNPV